MEPAASAVGAAGAERRVTMRAFSAALATLADDCDPRAGLFGPGSMMWTVGRESALIVGGPRSVLLQLAHPFVSESLKYASGEGRDVRARFIRTMRFCSAMTFGDRAEVLGAARSVYGIHRRVGGRFEARAGRFRRGARFEANDPDALWWVAATLWDSSVVAFETFVRPLALEEKNAYLSDCRRWSRLFGVPESVMAPDWPAFERYMEAMLASDTLAVTPRALRAARHVLRAPRRSTAPLFAWVRTLTAGLLPPRLRQNFELPFGSRERRIFAASVRALGPCYRRLPRILRHNPKYVRAMRRIEGMPPEHPVCRGLIRLLKSALR